MASQITAQLAASLSQALERIADLERRLSSVPLRPSGGGGGGNVNTVGGFAFYIATQKGNLPSVTAPAIGYTTSDGRYYMRIGAAWISFSHVE